MKTTFENGSVNFDLSAEFASSAVNHFRWLNSYESSSLHDLAFFQRGNG